MGLLTVTKHNIWYIHHSRHCSGTQSSHALIKGELSAHPPPKTVLLHMRSSHDALFNYSTTSGAPSYCSWVQGCSPLLCDSYQWLGLPSDLSLPSSELLCAECCLILYFQHSGRVPPRTAWAQLHRTHCNHVCKKSYFDRQWHPREYLHKM